MKDLELELENVEYVCCVSQFFLMHCYTNRTE